MATLSNIGAALMTDQLEPHLDWLKNGARDLEIQDFYQADLLDGDWRSKVDEATKLLGDYPGRMGIHGPFWGLDIANPDPLMREGVQKRLLQGLGAAEALGASHMVVHSPIDPWLHRHILHNDKQRHYVLDLMKKTLEQPLAEAERIGCTLVIENIKDLDLRLLRDLVSAFDSASLRMSIDVGHAYCMHIQHGAPTPDQYVAAAGSYLAHVHLQDSDGYIDRHWLPGEGDIGFKALFEELAKLEQEPRLIIEVKNKAAVQEAAVWLERFVPTPAVTI
ncbi:MAG: TIM barrel protein [Deinococcota bacterium]